MPSTVKYAALSTEESEDIAAEPVVLACAYDDRAVGRVMSETEVVVQEEGAAAATATVGSAHGATPPDPPPYDVAGATGEAAVISHEQEDDVDSPPPEYDVASKLPSYEEAERSKAEQATSGGAGSDTGETGSRFAYGYAGLLSGFEGYQEIESGGRQMPLGNDVVFFSTFLVSFLFNWIGFLVAHCFSQSIAGRFGALAGFGLSMIKWAVIMKHSFQLESVQTDWLWWIVLLLGLMMFFRGTVQYVRIKHQWENLSNEARLRYGRFF